MRQHEIEKLYERTKEFRSNAYAPYSIFFVGAGLKLKGHKEFFLGCNIENASYGTCICAEQVAITKGISENPGSKLEFLVLVTDTNPAAGPCGICLQIMNEFADSDFCVYIANLNGIQKSVRLTDLLTMGFNRSNLI